MHPLIPSVSGVCVCIYMAYILQPTVGCCDLSGHCVSAKLRGGGLIGENV